MEEKRAVVERNTVFKQNAASLPVNCTAGGKNGEREETV